MSLESILNEKNKRLESVPLAFQTSLERQQKKILLNIQSELSRLEMDGDRIAINSNNLKIVANISDELKTIFYSEDYLKAVKEFASEFSIQSELNLKLIKKTFGAVENPLAAKQYVDLAKRSAIDALVGAPADKDFIRPIQNILEQAVVNGSSFSETIDNITSFVAGGDGKESKILKYAKQITNDAFSIADRSQTSILSDYLGSEWFYFSGTEVENTRCFCKERVGNIYHYKEIESWANGENLGDCNIGNGKWAGEIEGTNASTIYSYLGGYNCLHSLMPVSIDFVSDSDIARAKKLGYIK